MHMVAERVTPSLGESYIPGPGLRIQQHRILDPAIYGSGLCDQQYRSPDELKIPDFGLYNTGVQALDHIMGVAKI